MLKKYQTHFGQFANILPYDIYWTLFMIVLKVKAKVKNIFTILHQMITTFAISTAKTIYEILKKD